MDLDSQVMDRYGIVLTIERAAGKTGLDFLLAIHAAIVTMASGAPLFWAHGIPVE